MDEMTVLRTDKGASLETAVTEAPLCRIPTDPTTIMALAERFRDADPFPHIVLDDVLTVGADQIARSFPALNWAGWHKWEDEYQAQKRYCGDFSIMPDLMRGIISELSQPAFLRFLEQISGISALMPDPYLEGGGLHSSGSGGILAPHTDFHLLQRLNLYRQINIILYLNPIWQEAWGGCLGMYRKGQKTPTRVVVPSLGRMVIFRTDHNSVHGFAVPVAEGHRRNSIALYYYTARDSADFGGDTTTYWQHHGVLSRAGKLQLAVHQRLLGLSTLVAKAAHIFNPHTGNFRSFQKP